MSNPSPEGKFCREDLEQLGESQKRKKLRISWKNERVVKTFLEACIHEVSQNGPKGASLHASSWKKVGEKLKTYHNLVADQKQMKNHYDYLKAKYKAWSNLKNKSPDMYDPLTNTFNFTEDEWKTEMKGNKYIESLKSTTLSFPKLCAQLFDGEASENGQSSSEKSLSCPEPLMIEDAEYIIETQETSTSKPNYSSHAEDQRPAKKAKTSKNSNASTIEEDMSKALNMIIGKNNGPSFKDCRDKLREIGWGTTSPLHKMALVIFCESETYREAWMQLQDDEVEDWVRMIGNKLRLEP